MDVAVSVVIPVRQAQATVESTLDAAVAQARAVAGEVIAAVAANDSSLAIVQACAARAGGMMRVIVAAGRCGVPQLRRDGVQAARAPWVVITEDHCLFPPDWLEMMLAGASDDIVLGGGVANGRRSYAGWAQYFTRYSAFLPPLAHGETPRLPGNNACYPRRLLASPSLERGFWEAEFNRELLGQGMRLVADPRLTVEQRQQRGWLEFMALRFRHGRCYGAGRAGSKVFLILVTPLAPVVLLWRLIRAQRAKRYHRPAFLLTLPLICCYLAAWSLGEAAGYIFGSGGACWTTD